MTLAETKAALVCIDRKRPLSCATNMAEQRPHSCAIVDDERYKNRTLKNPRGGGGEFLSKFTKNQNSPKMKKGGGVPPPPEVCGQVAGKCRK